MRTSGRGGNTRSAGEGEPWQCQFRRRVGDGFGGLSSRSVSGAARPHVPVRCRLESLRGRNLRASAQLGVSSNAPSATNVCGVAKWAGVSNFRDVLNANRGAV
jgi:hypothetical protein